MRILIVRHGDPDYDNDCLTPLGRHQAAALSRLLAEKPIERICASPLGRARETAEYTAAALGKTVEILPFLREMNDVVIPSALRDDLAIWHVPPRQALAADPNRYREESPFRESLLEVRLKELETGTASLLEAYGLRRIGAGYHYEADLSAAGDIAVFCHQGVGLTWIAYLLGISYLDMWRTCYISPTSYTTLLFEQSEASFGTFRMIGMGEIAHLARDGIEPHRTGLLYNRT